jgi:hypothetical protein
VAQGLEVVAAGLFAAEVCVDGHVSRCAGEGFPFAVGDVDFCFGVAVLFCHAKVDDVD